MKTGAAVTASGVEYCVWAPDAARVTVDIESAGSGVPRMVSLEKTANGYHCGTDRAGTAGDAYGFQLDGERLLPDPASRAQRDDVHGRSLVIDPRVFQWTDAAWRRPVFRDLAIYELHVGTFTPEGTFQAARTKLAYLAELGITAIELMPVADFPGTRNWGYDGVLIYAPARCYGSPDDLRALIDAAHGHGIAVILDVVYNHLGPDGNYLSAYSPHYFCRRHHTPWGDGFNFDSEHSQPVRRFFLQNPVYWMEEFHLDGFRFDATHQIMDDSVPHLLAEMSRTVHARGGYTIAEDARNEERVISEDGLGFNAVWADDFHHSLCVAQTGERFSYFQDFAGTAEELVRTLQHGWLYQGQQSNYLKRSRGTECGHLPPERFIHCISNHDQVGNRALGERIGQRISAEAYRALSVLICLTPYTPMFFMGQEWSATSPFLFFTDHNLDLGKQITLGRQKEFSTFPEFSGEVSIPDPQSEQAFRRSKLNWEEVARPEHETILALYRECLDLRRKHKIFRPDGRSAWSISLASPNSSVVVLRNAEYALYFNAQGSATVKVPNGQELVLSSEEARFGGAGMMTGNRDIVSFSGAAAMLFRVRDKE